MPSGKMMSEALLIERRRHLQDRVFRALLGIALDQHGLEDALADEAADAVLAASNRPPRPAACAP